MLRGGPTKQKCATSRLRRLVATAGRANARVSYMLLANERAEQLLPYFQSHPRRIHGDMVRRPFLPAKALYLPH